MNTYSTENIDRIKSIANTIRENHGAMEWGVTPQDLIERQGLEYSEYDLSDTSFIGKVTSHAKKIVDKIKAAIIVSERIILIDEYLHYAKKPFGQAHELGHDSIPEHKEILYVCSEFDLNQSVRKEMEFEANIFASELLFPSPLMETIHSNFPLSMQTILYLKNLSEGSIHSTAIKYVETSDKICCLLVLEKSTNSNGECGLQFNGNQISSDEWHRKYKRLFSKKQFLPEGHNLSTVVYGWNSSEFVETTISIVDSKLSFKAHVLYNQFKVFALIFEP